MNRKDFFNRIGLGAIGVIIAPQTVKALEKEKTVEVTTIVKGEDLKSIINKESEGWQGLTVSKNKANLFHNGNYVSEIDNLEMSYYYDNTGFMRDVKFTGTIDRVPCLPNPFHIEFIFNRTLCECDVHIETFAIFFLDKTKLEMSLIGALTSKLND